jgi:hypothetical protein
MSSGGRLSHSPYTARSTSDPKALSVVTTTTNAFTKCFTDITVPQIRNSKFIELTVKWDVPNSLPLVHTHSELNPAHKFQLRFILILFIPSQSSVDLPCVLFFNFFYESFISPLSVAVITQSVDGLNIKRFIPNALPLCYYSLTLPQLRRVSFLTWKTNYFNTGSHKLYFRKYETYTVLQLDLSSKQSSHSSNQTQVRCNSLYDVC